ncbi:hypothetical protein Ocin01_17511, partial [Orchesella cincta]
MDFPEEVQDTGDHANLEIGAEEVDNHRPFPAYNVPDVQALPSNFYLDTELATAERVLEVRQRNVFNTAEQIQTFLKEIEGHTGNPFPGRTLILEPHDPRQLGAHERNRICTNYWRSVNDLVE